MRQRAALLAGSEREKLADAVPACLAGADQFGIEKA
jgi:hypothetical protein